MKYVNSYSYKAWFILAVTIILTLMLLTGGAVQARDLDWAKSAGGTVSDEGGDIAVDGLGNTYVTGFFQAPATFGEGEDAVELTSADGSRDIFVAKYDSDGSLLWAKSAGGTDWDVGRGIAIDGLGNTYVTGYFNETATFGEGEDAVELTSVGEYRDIFVAKYDSGGSLLWAKSAGGTELDSGEGIVVDGFDNAYVTGDFGFGSGGTATFGEGEDAVTLTSFGDGDIFVAKYDSDGSLLWAKSAGGTHSDTGYGITVDGLGNTYVTGVFGPVLAGGSALTATFGEGVDAVTLTSAGYGDLFVAKYDSGGSLLWAKSAGGEFNDVGWGIAVDGLGNTYVTGNFHGTATFGEGEHAVELTSAGSGDLFVVKYDSDGSLLWAKSAPGTGRASGLDLALDDSGKSYLTGHFGQTATFGEGEDAIMLTSEGSLDIFVAKYDSDGSLHWAKSAGGTNDDLGWGIAVDGLGNTYVTGYFARLSGGTATFGEGEDEVTLTSAGGTDIFVAKYSPSPVEAIEELINNIEDMGLPADIEVELTEVFDNVIDFLNDNNPNNDNAVCGKLRAFVNKVNSMEKQGDLTMAQADQLRTWAEAIRTKVGCS